MKTTPGWNYSASDDDCFYFINRLGPGAEMLKIPKYVVFKEVGDFIPKTDVLLLIDQLREQIKGEL